ncbi:putative cytochrome P450 [Gordonia araii NBRC 100433]|uniref:Putative cytochrome P450 n=1 Tax=Gordonia araii NBRC 100433 TaxID=1073574 RepID=G7GXA0_9ACTN|nr:cytochrome P450 [Gordonia araii]NNG98998.1 cytochrome P450 [Gordonia araii NBRC 100433]GAB08225.1 putative cytochrome P450 [Gordonia araii NBRC 100433]
MTATTNNRDTAVAPESVEPFPKLPSLRKWGVLREYLGFVAAVQNKVSINDSDRLSANLRRHGEGFRIANPNLPKRATFLMDWIIPGHNLEFLTLNTPQLCRELYGLSTEDADFEIGKDPFLRFFLGPNTPFILQGKEHAAVRRAMTPELTQAAVERYREVSIQVLDRHLDELPLNTPVSLQEMFYQFTREVILRVIFGLEDEDREEIDSGISALSDLMNGRNASIRTLLTYFPLALFYQYFRKDREHLPRRRARRIQGPIERMDALIARQIARFRADPTIDCPGARIVAKADAAPEMWTPEILRDAFRTLLIAGHETSVTGYSFTIDLLLKNPDKLALVREEALAAATDSYAIAANNEGLRLHPPVWGVPVIPRKDVVVGGRRIHQGTWVQAMPAAIHHDPEAYPEPTRFLPERFLDKAPDRYGFMAFGTGKHRCPGISFYQLEASIVLHRIFGRLELRHHGRAERAYLAFAAFSRPALGMQVVVTDRKPADEVPCFRAKGSEDRERAARMRAPEAEDFPDDGSPRVIERETVSGAPAEVTVCPITGAQA